MHVCCRRRAQREPWRAHAGRAILAAQRADRREHARLELVEPPLLPQDVPVQLSKPVQAEEWDPLKRTHEIGTRGATKLSRAQILHGMIEAERGQDHVLLLTLTNLFFREHMLRLLADERWCGAYAKAAASLSAPGRIVCVIGIGSTIPALTAARSGASVLWIERVDRLAMAMQMVIARNGMSKLIRVARTGSWADLPNLISQLGYVGRLDAVLTEELGDEVVGDDLLPLAQVSHSPAYDI